MPNKEHTIGGFFIGFLGKKGLYDQQERGEITEVKEIDSKNDDTPID